MTTKTRTQDKQTANVGDNVALVCLVCYGRGNLWAGNEIGPLCDDCDGTGIELNDEPTSDRCFIEPED